MRNGQHAGRAAAGVAVLWLASAAALVAAVGGVGTIADAGEDTLVVETWRTVGLATFAGLFALLALRPRVHVAVWAVVAASKLALGIAGAVVLLTAEGGAPEGAVALVAGDGLLAGLLVVSYLLLRPARVEGRSVAGTA